MYLSINQVNQQYKRSITLQHSFPAWRNKLLALYVIQRISELNVGCTYVPFIFIQFILVSIKRRF